MPKISVIMPSYNVARYIEPCIKSVLCQTLSDLEILAVDAGSADGTWEILQSYAKQDARLRCIHSDQKSYGYQMNVGLSLAKGDYIGIVETDDIIAEDMYETLYQAAREFQADYVKGSARAFWNISEHVSWNLPIAKLAADRQIKKAVPCHTPQLLLHDIYIWNGIYRREFLQGIRFHETSGAAFQDQGFLLQTISRAECAIYLAQPVYWYRQDNSGSSIYNKRGFSYLKIEYARNEQFLARKAQAWHNVFYRRLLNQCLGRFRTMAVSGAFWEEAFADMEELRITLQRAVNGGILREESLEESQKAKWDLFLKGPHVLYESYVEEYREKAETCRRLFRAAGGRPVIIFGCGQCGTFLHALSEQWSAGLAAAYCDNLSALWGREVQGLPVLSPEEAAAEYPGAVFFITSVKYAENMKTQLNSLGVPGGRIYTYTGGIDMLLFYLLKPMQ